MRTERRVTVAGGLRVSRSAKGGPRLEGHAAVFNSVSDPISGCFRETIAPGAFAASLASGPDVVALVDHEPRLVLGRRSAGTLECAEDDRGLAVGVDLPDTSYARDLQASVERGDVTGMSFGFECEEDEWADPDAGADLPMRRLLRVRLFDVSAVTFPAYPDTDVAVRSLLARRRGRAMLMRMRLAQAL